METAKVQKWNQWMKMLYYAMIMISVLSIIDTMLEWSYYYVDGSLYDYEYSDFSRMTNNVTTIIGYLCTTFWIFGVIGMFCLSQLIDEQDRNDWSMFKIGALVYTALVVLGTILSLLNLSGMLVAIILMLIRMGCFVMMMVGAIKLSNSKTFPNGKWMSMIMLSIIFILVGYICYLIMYIMIYTENYDNLNVLANFGNVFSLVSDIFWIIGWVKLTKRIN